MRKVSNSIRVGVPQYRRGADRHVGGKVSSDGAAGGPVMVLLAILLWLLFYQNLPDNLNGMAAEGGAMTGDLQNRLVKIVLIVMSGYVIATRWSLARSLARNYNLGGAVFLGLTLLSAAWSVDPATTVFRFISLLSLFALCFAICLAGWNRQRFQQMALPPLMAILLASLVVGIIFPDRITERGNDISQRDAWHGITHAKNEFGMMASLGVLICVNRILAREGRAFWAIAGAAAAFACLILSRSNTSLFATLLGGLCMVLLMRVPVIRQRYSTHVVVAIAAAILLYELVVQNVIPGVATLMAPVMRLTGKDMTFSGRSIIWDVVKEHIRAAPYLGTGYGAYWLGPQQGSPSHVFMYTMFFYPSEAHNGYLDVINDLGYLGLGVLLLYVFSYIRQALQLMRFDRTQAAMYLAVLFQEMVMNMSESDWFSRTSTFAVLLLASTCLSRGLLESRSRAQSARPVAR